MPLRALSVEVVDGPDVGVRISVRGDTLTGGTAPGNDLRLTDPTVSRFHFELRNLGDRIEVRDLASTNGMWVGGLELMHGFMSPGAILAIGKTRVRIDDAGQVEAELLDGDRMGDLRGRSPAMRRLMATIAKIAASDVSALLLGETGVGKEVVARAIHAASPRAQGPFETVDCGAIAPALVASELFGHERGAFTGADERRIGAFERAHGGTLFLDEVGELPASLQPALLGALERRSFRRVGGSERIDVNVRVVSATLRELRSDVNRDAFRPDLFYRLAVVTLSVPPLRERKNDIPLLIEHFLRRLGHSGAVEELFPGVALQQLLEHRWPGNVRELRNFVEATVAMGESPPLQVRTPRDSNSTKYPVEEASATILPFKDARQDALSDFEENYLRVLMARCEGNISSASRMAGVNRSYLQEMLRKYGLR